MFAVFFSIVLSMVSIFFTAAIKGVADACINGDIDSFKRYIILALITVVIENPSTMLKIYGFGRFAEYSIFDIRRKTAEYINNLTVPFIDTHLTGDMISRLTNDVGIIAGFLQGSAGELIYQPLLFLLSSAYLFILSWKLALFSLTVVPVILLCAMKMSTPIRKYSKEHSESVARLNSVAQDSLSGLMVTKSFNLEKAMEEKYDKAVKVSVKKSLKVTLTQALMQPAQIVMHVLPFILTFIFGGYLVIGGDLTFGGLLGFINLLNSVINPIIAIPNHLAAMRSAEGTAERIFEVWDREGERKNGESFPADSNSPVISFKNISFSYEGKDILFMDLSFDIKMGETVALVGHSGCGKSTVLKLVTGFYNPAGGSISVWGKDINEWNLEGLRSMFSLVSQDTYLFPESIYENIAYGREDAGKEEIIEAAKTACIHDVIMAFPGGYDTVVGERGVKLSGGQRQRVAIARALLKDAPILLLDEATSALDVESEHGVQAAIAGLMKGRTTFVIAHRLSTIINADRILVLDNGIIAESGTHDELIKKDGIYKQLYIKQLESYDGADREIALAGR
jgi:ABC-type multidrug transport system, ATPase and permease components